MKLATELSRRPTGKTVYILDEPTTGLHIADVHRLIDVLQKLVDTGNTVIVIEPVAYTHLVAVRGRFCIIKAGSGTRANRGLRFLLFLQS